MPLPAPYAPPWKRLGEDGVALLAWLGLKLRELWRRNREGTLPVPGFWPRRRTRLFWPLVLAALLLGAGLVGRAWLSRPATGLAETSRFSPPWAEGAAAGESTAEKTTAALAGQDEPLDRPPALDPEPPLGAGPALNPEPPLGAETSLGGDLPSRPVTAQDAATLFAPTPDPDGGRTVTGDGSAGRARGGTGGTGPAENAGQAPADGTAATPVGQATPAPEDQEANRLRAAWSAAASEPLIAAFRPEPASATLTLTLADAFIALQTQERQRQAERWHQRAAEAGYSHLRLRDGRGRLLARDALVGGGMVVLEPPGEGPEAP